MGWAVVQCTRAPSHLRGPHQSEASAIWRAHDNEGPHQSERPPAICPAIRGALSNLRGSQLKGPNNLKGPINLSSNLRGLSICHRQSEGPWEIEPLRAVVISLKLSSNMLPTRSDPRNCLWSILYGVPTCPTLDRVNYNFLSEGNKW